MSHPNLEKFAIAKRLSKNAFYTAYNAVDRETGQSCILKLIDRKLSSNKDDILEIFKINKIISLINNVHFRKPYDYGLDGNYYYLATQSIDSNQVFSLNEAEAAISLSKFIDDLINIANALRDAHVHGVVHGCLHPDCIYVSPGGSLIIDDFGFYLLVPYLPNQEKNLNDTFMSFIAPEIAQEMTNIDGRADIYSIGMLLFQAMNGNLRCFDSSFLSTRDKDALISITENLFLKSLNEIPFARFQNLQIFIEELQNISHQLAEPSEVKVVSEEETKYLPEFLRMSYFK